jgi:hypothetical protein
MIRRRRIWLFAGVLFLVSSQAWAIDVFLNGVRITGVRNQAFENATVRLDQEGNVRIDAPQYRVERTAQAAQAAQAAQGTSGGGESSPATSAASQGSPSPATTTSSQATPPAASSPLTRRYWLVAQTNQAGMVQYRFEVVINGRLVRRFTDADLPGPLEVTEYLRQGSNRIQIVAEKITGETRRSESSRHWVRLAVAEGHIENRAVVIDQPGVIFTRNATHLDRIARDFQLTAR